MPGQYTLKVVMDFAAAHQLRDYAGECARLHGHNWKLEVEVTASALDKAGMGLDFKVIRAATKRLADELDHHFLNERPPFDRISPTAENIAAHFYAGLSRQLNDERVRISAVTIWETERACARYSET